MIAKYFQFECDSGGKALGIFIHSKMLSLLECMGILNPSAKLSAFHQVACRCKGCVSILVNCARDLAVTEFCILLPRRNRFHSRMLLQIASPRHVCLKMQLVYGCRISLSWSWSVVGTCAESPVLLYTGWCLLRVVCRVCAVLEQPHHPGQGPDTA